MIDVLSLGAGVQSTTLALLAAERVIEPMPAAAVFADTGAEPAAVYRHLDWLETVLPFPVRRVQWRNIIDDMEATARGEPAGGRGEGYLAAPFFTRNADGSRGMLRRECTSNYKIAPIRTELKRLLGRDPAKQIRLRRGAPALVRQWIGISRDEWHRMNPARERWIDTSYPLVDRRWTRGHCLEWLAERGYPTPPRSACTFCPYRSNAEYRALSPDDLAQARHVDRLVRDMPATGSVAGLRQGGRLYVHRDLLPLTEVDLTDPHAGQLDLWPGECSGMCGV